MYVCVLIIVVHIMVIAGISGWYPVNAASHGWDVDDRSNEQRCSELSCWLDRVVGGLELSVKFAHSDDRDRVIHAARGVGWASIHDVEHGDWCEAGRSSLLIILLLPNVIGVSNGRSFFLIC